MSLYKKGLPVGCVDGSEIRWYTLPACDVVPFVRATISIFFSKGLET